MCLSAVAIRPPWEQPRGNQQRTWELIVRYTNLDISWKVARNRWKRLCNARKSENWENMRRSGTEEEYKEREQLLDELIALEEDSRSVREKTKKKINELAEKGQELRRAALESFRKRRVEDSKVGTRSPAADDANNADMNQI